VLVIAAMALGACAPAATSAPTSAPTQPPAATQPSAATQPPAATGSCPLQVESGAKISFSGWGDASEQQVYKDSITRFNAVCPGVSVDYIPIPDKFQDKMKAQMAGGTAPDVF